MIAKSGADVVFLQGVDYDHGLAGLAAFRDTVAEAGRGFPHLFSLRPNTGYATGLDIDGDGRLRGARDAQGFGAFAGQGGMAVLSRWPVELAQDHSGFLWKDLPETLISPDDPAHATQRLSSVAHWTLAVDPPGAPPLHLLAYHATPPVFDGPADRNGRRNHDETAFWRYLLDGALNVAASQRRFVILGDANLDPEDGEGRRSAIRALLAHPALQDAAPQSREARAAAKEEGGANTFHRGDSARDTANWRDDPGPGNLRVDYVLPSADWTVTGSGVLWAEPVGRGGEGRRRLRHGLVWVDLR